MTPRQNIGSCNLYKNIYKSVALSALSYLGVSQKCVFKKRKRRTSSDVLGKVDAALQTFISYQQQADKAFLEAERERERREEEREEKRRREDQDFLLRLAEVLKK